MDSLSQERLQDENVYIKKITVSRVNETTSPEEKRNNAMHYTVTCPMKEVLGFNLDNNLRDFYFWIVVQFSLRYSCGRYNYIMFVQSIPQ